MNPKVIAVVAIAVVAVVCVAAYVMLGQGEKRDDPVDPVGPDLTGNAIVIYFSATGVTEDVAETIVDITKLPSYQIVPKVPYTTEDLNRDNKECRAAKECRGDLPLPEIGSKDIDLSKYSVIFLGFPIWYKEEPPMMHSFIDKYDLTGKTVIPFSTSWGSGIATAQSNLSKDVPGAFWIKGQNFLSTFTADEVEEWLTAIGYLKTN